MALVGRIYVLFSHRVVEFRVLGPHEDIIIGSLSIVDLGASDVNIGGGNGGDVLDEKFRKTFRRDAVHRPHDDPISVRVIQMLIDPRPGGQRRVGEFSRGKHDLAIFAVYGIAVIIHIDELVIGADLVVGGGGKIARDFLDALRTSEGGEGGFSSSGKVS